MGGISRFKFTTTERELTDDGVDDDNMDDGGRTFSCYMVWMRMMMKMTTRAPTDNDFLLQRWMQKENMLRNMLKQESSDRQTSPQPKQMKENLVCSTAARRKYDRAEKAAHTHTHPITLNIQTHVISSLDRGKTHTHCGNASPQQASQPHPLW